MGISTSKIVTESKWPGPCKPGQKEGDIIGPGGVSMNNMNRPGMSNMTPQDREKRRQAMEKMMKEMENGKE